MMARKSCRDNPEQLPLFNTNVYKRHITEASIDCDGYEKSSTVEPKIVERENFLDLGLAVGDTFLFNTDRCHRHVQIVNRAWNNEWVTIEDLNPPSHPGRVQVKFASGRHLWLKAEDLPLYGWVKSSTVEPKIVERENFQWVEQYVVKRYLYWRYCHLRCHDDIERVVKLHIPGAGRSVRDGRAEMVKEAIALGKSPQEIEQLINSWAS